MRDFRPDLRSVKSAVGVPAVLERYGLHLRPEGDRMRGQCPFQIGTGHGKTAFIAWDNGWMCHSCGKKGNVLDLVAEKEGVDVWQAAWLLYEWFNLATIPATRDPPLPVRATGPPPETDVSNSPLRFRLRLDPRHPFGSERGFEPGHCEHLSCGYCAGDGAMAGRWTFPVHDVKGRIVGYAGRLIDDSAIADRNPRWRFTKGFRKSLELYNLHRVLRGRSSNVVVVESFWGVLACVRAGVMNAVALMGRTLSSTQAELLAQFPSIVLLLDGDEPGRQASRDVSRRLIGLPSGQWVRVLVLADGAQPDRLEPEALKTLIRPF